MKRKSLPAIRWAVGYAILWGCLTVVVPFFYHAQYASLGVAWATSLLGAIIIALGFGVYRRSELAAWALVTVAVFDIVVRILMYHTGLLMPLILLVLAVQAGIYLRRHRQGVVVAAEPVLLMSPTPEAAWSRPSWPALLAGGAAFLQVGIAVLLLLRAAEEGRLLTGIEGVNIYSLIDLVILSAFGIAVLKRHLWATYALVGYGLIDYSVKVVQTGDPWAAYFVIYIIAALFLRKKPHVAPETIRMLQWRSILKYSIVWHAGFEIIAFIFGLLGPVQGGMHRSTEMGVANILLLVAWGVTLFGFQAWREPTWSFETALITSVAVFPLNFVDAPVVQMTPAVLLLRLLVTVAIAMLGVGCASMLPKRIALVSEAETQ